MSLPVNWQARAYNQATESENRIHSDDVAKQYGFKGGLVPGVTVYAYLAHPALAAWGKHWLSRGHARITLHKPLYEGSDFRVLLRDVTGSRYHGEVRDDGDVLCADGEVGLSETPEPMPAMRGDERVPARQDRRQATREVMEELVGCMRSLRIEWRGDGELDRYVADARAMPPLVQPDSEGFANPAFSLGLANWILARNVRLGPWIHVDSQVQNHAPIPLGSATIVESKILELFDRGGHEFVELDVCVYFEDGSPVLRARHKAIYVLKKKA